MSWANCKTCVHYEKDWAICEECEHCYRELFDHYEKATTEYWTELRSKKLEELEKAMGDEFIPMEIQSDFKKAFENARRCSAAGEDDLDCIGERFFPVNATDDYLLATNGRIVLFLNCIIPDQLKNKHIVGLNNTGAWIHTNHLKWTEQAKDMPYSDNTMAFSLSLIKSYKTTNGMYSGCGDLVEILDPPILLRKQYLNIALELLGDEISLSHRGPLQPIVLRGNNGQMVIAPLRRGIQA